MVAESKLSNGEAIIRIENNVLKGVEVPNMYTNYNNVGELLLEKMRSAPNNIAQLDALNDVEDTYANLLDRVIKCALWMKKQGIRRGDVIAIATHNHINSVVPCVAATCIGAIFNPWDSDMNLQSARHFANLSQPKVIFLNEDSTRVAKDAFKIEGLQTKVVAFDEDANGTTFADILEGHTPNEVENFQCEKMPDLNLPLMILYSSGTTGLPKGVQLSHTSVLQQMSTAGIWDLEGQIPLWFSNFYWISGTLLSFNAILSLNKRIVFPFFDEKRTCELIQKYAISWVFLSSSMTNRWIKSGYPAQYDLPSLDSILTGGAVLKRDMQSLLQENLPNAKILQGYGMTETGGVISCQRAGSPSGSCGLVSANVQVKIINPETGKILGANQPGEIVVKTATMTIGYYRNPEATKETIDEDGWIHTGDLGYYDDAGELFIVDRLKELMKFRGRHISPGVIENVLHMHPEVVEAAVVGLPHLTDDEHPIAFVRLQPGSNVTAEELIDVVAKNVLDHERLRGGVKFIEKFPETATGKIARKQVKAMATALLVKN